MYGSMNSWALKILTNADMLKLPVDIVRVARSQGISVYETDELPKEILGAVKWVEDDGGEYRILIAKETEENYSEERYRIALLVAECILNGKNALKSDPAKIFILKRNEMVDETLTDMADSLLMEKNIFKDLYEIRPDLTELSKVFYVTVSRVTKRAIDLGLL